MKYWHYLDLIIEKIKSYIPQNQQGFCSFALIAITILVLILSASCKYLIANILRLFFIIAGLYTFLAGVITSNIAYTIVGFFIWLAFSTNRVIHQHIKETKGRSYFALVTMKTNIQNDLNALESKKNAYDRTYAQILNDKNNFQQELTQFQLQVKKFESERDYLYENLEFYYIMDIISHPPFGKSYYVFPQVVLYSLLDQGNLKLKQNIKTLSSNTEIEESVIKDAIKLNFQNLSIDFLSRIYTIRVVTY